MLFISIVAGAYLFFNRDNAADQSEGGVAYAGGDVVLETPVEGGVVLSPVTIAGKARGPWFFEASFPVMLVDWDGLIIAEGIATAQSDWMTEELVPFEATLTFEKPALYPERGALILKKDNPSGLPEFDAAVEIPIRYE